MRVSFFIFFCLLFNVLNGQEKDPILFTVGEDPVSLSEFQYIYEKNNADKADYSKESLAEYLELYKKFKLKVRRAKEIGLDTVKVLQQELEGYRKQLAKSYLKDKEIADRLIDEVAERMKEDVDVSHIFVSAPPKSAQAKIDEAEQKINDIYAKLNSLGVESFGDIAKSLSEDKSSSMRSGRLGYYTAPLPDGFYEFENAMYNTASGEFSKPVKSKMGFHIIKVKEKRSARGQMEIAHILFRMDEKAPKFKMQVKEIADSVYNLLKKGRSFENMAAKFSGDSKSKSKGGYLGFFGVNQYELTFENAAFGLENDGDFSKPIQTKLGYHIIKRISKRDDSDEKRLRKRIQTRIKSHDRFRIAEEKMIEDVKKEGKFSEDRLALKRLSTAVDETFYSYKWTAPTYKDNLKLFSLGGNTYTLNDFTKYAKTNVRERLKFSKNKPLEESVNELYADYVKDAVMSYEEANLERKYPEFRSLMREYREGILLFEITKQEVWDKASKDTTGLKTFFESSDKAYMWPERVSTYKYSLESDSETNILSAYKYAQKKDHDKFIAKFADGKTVKIKSIKQVLDKTSPEISDLAMKKDGLSQLNLNPTPASFYRYVKKIEPTPKTLAEAKGYVIADYQDYLEAEWIKRLKKEYKIKLNQAVLDSVTK